MVDYDVAAAAVQDPNVDPAFLARIAYENPEFGACVAANQRAYPGLLAWLAEFGTPEAKEWVAKRTDELPASARVALAALNSSAMNPAINSAFSNMAPGSAVQQFTYEQSVQQQPYGYVEQQRSIVTEQPQMAFSSPLAASGMNPYAGVAADSQAMSADVQGLAMQQQPQQVAMSSNGLFGMQQQQQPYSASPAGAAGVTAMPAGMEGMQQPQQQQQFAGIAAQQQPQVQASAMQQPAMAAQSMQQPMVQPQLGIQQQPMVNLQQPVQQQQAAFAGAAQQQVTPAQQAAVAGMPQQDAAAAAVGMGVNPAQAADNNPLVVNGYTSEQALTVTDPMVQRDIAVKAPALDPYLMQNPSLYPELRQWLENRQNK